MSDDQLIRHDNFKRKCGEANLTARILADRFKDGEVFKGGYSYWQGLLNGSRPFGEKVARRIEDELGWKRYSLDEAPGQMSEGYVRLDARERVIVEQYRSLSRDARALDNELAQFGAKRSEAYQRVIEFIEKLRPELLSPAPSPNAPSAAQPKKKQPAARKTRV